MEKMMLIKKNPVIVNPNQLFHRIACVVRSEADLEEYLWYELAPYPQSLFDNVGLRKGIKSKIISFVSKICELNNNLPENARFFLNGGDLLHRLHCPRPACNLWRCVQRIPRVIQQTLQKQCHRCF